MQYAMVIDLQKCVGCGACGIACKTENNTQARKNGQTYNWADFIFDFKGKFPTLEYETKPVLCNHCSDAPCVESCPVSPKAMFKTDSGITMHNDERCIGCRNCQASCPYSAMDVETEGAAYSVIHFNFDDGKVFDRFRDTTELIKGGTSSGRDVAKKAGALPPTKTLYKHPDYEAVRRSGIVEKCILCEHRLAEGEAPWCVASCPSKARTVGDMDNPASDVAKLLKKHKATVLKPEAGTNPNVYYVRNFKVKA